MKEFVVAKSRKRTVKKQTKKRRKVSRVRVKRAVARKTSKKSARKGAKKSAKKSGRRSVRRPASKSKPTSKSETTSVAKRKAEKPKVTPAASIAKAPAQRSTKSFYITTAIAYPNGAPHIGHAYEAIATDALARFQRLDGKDVFFLTGTDEHGQKMIQTADAEKLTPMQVATRNAGRFKEMDQRLNISFD